MRDNRYTNMWGEDEEEQKKRREWLRQVYDDAIIPDTDIQTPLNQDNNHSKINNSFGQTPEPVGVTEQKNSIYDKIKSTYDKTFEIANNLNQDNTINNDKYSESSLFDKSSNLESNIEI